MPEHERTMSYYTSARLDGLVQRHEVFGQKMTELFGGRDDHLVGTDG